MHQDLDLIHLQLTSSILHHLYRRAVYSTHTDYVTRYPSILQTSSYHFTRTGTTPEICAGVVKAVPIHDKNPGQHAADFSMLMEKEILELHTAFHSPDGNPKNILCARVDGTMDEGRSIPRGSLIFLDS